MTFQDLIHDIPALEPNIIENALQKTEFCWFTYSDNYIGNFCTNFKENFVNQDCLNISTVFNKQLMGDSCKQLEDFLRNPTEKSVFFLDTTKNFNGKYWVLRTAKLDPTSTDQYICTCTEIKFFKDLLHNINSREYIFRAVSQFGNAGIVILNKEYEILDLSQNSLDILGFTREKLIGQKFENFIIPDDESSITTVEEMFSSESKVDNKFSFHCMAADQSQKFVSAHASKYNSVDSKIDRYVMIIEDNSAEIKLKEEKKSAQRFAERSLHLASIGTLAAGIIHEINQPLTALKAELDGILLMEELGKSLSHSEIIQSITDSSKQINRISEIVKHIRSLVKKDSKEYTVKSHFNDAIKRAVTILNHQIKANGIDIIYELDESIDMQYFDPILFEQIMINLLSNSVKAFRKSQSNNKHISIRTLRTGNHIMLQIEDNGIGIPEDEIDQIFDPLYTKSSIDSNMGIGLPIVASFVKTLGGTITASNSIDIGAIFTILLPEKANENCNC
jgi:PAS domain S-box-containing protein